MLPTISYATVMLLLTFYVNDELSRFPERDTCHLMRSYLRDTHEYIQALQTLENRRSAEEVLEAQRKHCDWLYRAWDTLDDARVYKGAPWAIEHLIRLRELIGEDNYRRGLMPSPYWGE